MKGKGDESQTPLPSHALRVALVWNECVQDEVLLRRPQNVLLGYGEGALLPLPEGQAARGDVTLLSAVGDGYQLHLTPEARGAVWRSGQRREVLDLLQRSPTLAVGPGDFGVVSLGAASYFFQFVRQPTEDRPLPPWLDGDTALSVGLSLFLHVVVFLLMLLAYRESPPQQTLELDQKLLASFMATPPLPEPEPPKEAPESGDETEDPGLKEKNEGGGRRAPRDEGRVGKKDAQQDQTEIEGERDEAVVAKVRGVGVLGALAGGNALASALEAPDVSGVLSGLNSVRNVAGRGSGGGGLRGVGKGGGGDDSGGGLYGAGDLGTGVGKGAGGGGRGKGGAGARGKPRKETKVSISQGKAAVVGHLSREEVLRVVKRNWAALRYCYESEVQRNRGLSGKVVLQWRVAPDGRVSTARVAQSTMHNPRVEGCLVRQVRKWRFPPVKGGEAQVMFPFIFGVGG